MSNYTDSYSSLEEALKAMMLEKMQAHNMIVMLYPADEDLNKRWDDAGHMVGVFASFVGKDGNFFNRMKINSQNKKAHAEFRKFLISLEPYLWKLQ
ncbi:MAG: hypothetical protein K2N35_06025 [Muribaculaceae bacterium]|nr:hypothetical protein [Muribaculaceae bacterium]